MIFHNKFQIPLNWDVLCLSCSFACELSELTSSSSSPLPQKQTRKNLKCETSSECRALQQMVTKRQQSLHEKEFRNREKRFTAASIQGEIRVPPSPEHAEINVSLLGLTDTLKGGLAPSIVEPIYSEYHSELLPSFVISHLKIQFKVSPKLKWPRPS